MADKTPEMVERTLRSPALYLGELKVTQPKSRGLGLLTGGGIKDVAHPFLYWAFRTAPGRVAMFPLKLLAFVFRCLYRMPGNSLRESCESICAIAERAGHRHDPHDVYRRFLRNVVAAGEGYRRLCREELEQVVETIEVPADVGEKMKRILDEHGGYVMTVPHNQASAFSSPKVSRIVPMLLVMRNSATIRRTQLAIEIFERMQTRILMVRAGNPFELSRAMFKALKDGMVVAATVDNVNRTEGRVMAEIFGVQVGLAPWAAKIAVKMKRPIVPTFFTSEAHGRVRLHLGEPLVAETVEQAVQHYVDFFEQKILEDPASWAYLADTKWRRVMREAAQGPSPARGRRNRTGRVA